MRVAPARDDAARSPGPSAAAVAAAAVRLDRDERAALLAALLAALVARGALFFTPVLSTDDFVYFFGDNVLRKETLDLVLQGGRWLLLLSLGLHDLAEATPPQAFTLLPLATHAALAWLFLVASRPWGLRGGGDRALLAAAFVVHPIGAEYVHFQLGQLAYAAAFAGAALFAELSRRGGRGRAAGAGVALFLAIAAYPIAIHFALLIVVLDFAAAFLRTGSLAEARAAARPVARAALVVLVTAVFFLAWKLSLPALGLEPEVRSALLDPAAAWRRLGEFLGTAGELAFGYEPDHAFGYKRLLPPALQALTVAGWLLLAWALVLARRPARLAVAGAALAAGLVCVFGTALLLAFWWPAPRVLGAYGLLVMFPLGVVLAGAGGPRARSAGRLLAGGVLALGCWTGNRVAHDGLLLRDQEAALAVRVVQRLEAAPGFDARLPVVVVAAAASRLPLRPVSTLVGDLNFPALAKVWADVGVLNRATGYRFVRADPAAVARAEAYCAAAGAPWPAASAVTVLDGGVGVACLTPAP